MSRSRAFTQIPAIALGLSFGRYARPAWPASRDARMELSATLRKSGHAIIPLTVREILDEQIAHTLT